MSIPNTPIANGAALPFTPPTGGTGGATTQAFAALGFGSFVANGATSVTVVDPGVTANSIIIPTLKTVGGTVSPNALNVKTITPGTGFTIAGTASDTSTYSYLRIG